MLRRKLGPGLMFLILAMLVEGCGSYKKTTTKTPPPDTGGLVILVGDDPACDIMSFRANIRGMKLMPQDGSANVSPFSTDPFILINFASLRDTQTVLHIGQVNVGTYDKAEIDFGINQVAIFKPTSSPPVQDKSTSAPNTTPIYSIDPPLVITKDEVAGLKVDFDLRKSVSISSTGALSSSFSPVINLSTLTAKSTNGFGRLEDLNGFVLSVTNTSTDPSFTGSFAMQLLSGSSQVPVVSVSMKEDTDLVGVSGLNQLLGGAFVEVNGIVDSKGNIVADAVEVEPQQSTLTNRLALIGPILTLNRDTNGNAKDFDLLVAEEQPESQFTLPLHTVIHVTLSSSTKYEFSSRSLNFASLPFDPSSLAVGQEVVVHGQFTKASDDTYSVPAQAVYLKLQARQGNFSSLVRVGSDNKTGAFYMAPCEQVFQGSNILVFTNSATAFVNTSGLGGLTAQPLLLVKGLLFHSLAGGTVRGIAVPADTLVLLANQVHANP
jgi:Domain of unknown function (DUF5666)